MWRTTSRSLHIAADSAISSSVCPRRVSRAVSRAGVTFLELGLGDGLRHGGAAGLQHLALVRGELERQHLLHAAGADDAGDAEVEAVDPELALEPAAAGQHSLLIL